MSNYEAVSRWAASLSAGDALEELQAFTAKYPWAKLAKTSALVKQFHDDLPKIGMIVKLQEKRIAMLEFEINKLRGFIQANRMADEILLDEIKAKYDIDL